MMSNKKAAPFLCLKLTNFLLCLSKVATNALNVFQEKKKVSLVQEKIHLIYDVITQVPDMLISLG